MESRTTDNRTSRWWKNEAIAKFAPQCVLPGKQGKCPHESVDTCYHYVNRDCVGTYGVYPGMVFGMISVTSEIKRLLKEKDRAVITGERAMQGVMQNLHKQIMGELGSAALSSWDTYYLKKLLNNIESLMGPSQAAAVQELSGLLDTMWDRGSGLVDTTLRVGGLSAGSFHIGRGSIDVLKHYSSSYLEKLFGDAWHGVKGEINLGILGAKTPQEVATAIGKTMQEGKFRNYANRAETITRTEMGRIFSEATQARMAEATEHVAGLEKQWVHAGHPRAPRPSHIASHGQHVPVKEPFQVGGYRMMFPRDPAAPVSQIIHCGCDHVPYLVLWGETPQDKPAATLFSKVKNKALRTYAEEGMKNINPGMSSIISRYAPDCLIRKSTVGSYYDPGKKTIFISAEALEEHGVRALRHEFGHFVDMSGGKEQRFSKARSVSSRFTPALHKEARDIFNDSARTARLVKEICNYKGTWYEDIAVSDLFGAVTNNSIVGRRGHFGTYYEDRAGWGRQMQAFANLFEIAVRVDTTALTYVKAELPRLWRAFMEIVNAL